MGCQWRVASNVQEALTMLEGEEAAVALLDVPKVMPDPHRFDKDLTELRARLPGQIIVLAESLKPQIAELIEKFSIPFVRHDHLMMDLWPVLAPMLFSLPEPRGVPRLAHLVLDTFLQPLPAGIRHAHPDTRQLVYEIESLTVDVSLERIANSDRVALLGQILHTNGPQLPLKSIAVVLKGQNGPLGARITNESGEFLFEFQAEPKVTLEVEVGSKNWISFVSPPLLWDGSETMNGPRSRSVAG
jgi:hypothetical protein